MSHNYNCSTAYSLKSFSSSYVKLSDRSLSQSLPCSSHIPIDRRLVSVYRHLWCTAPMHSRTCHRFPTWEVKNWEERHEQLSRSRVHLYLSLLRYPPWEDAPQQIKIFFISLMIFIFLFWDKHDQQILFLYMYMYVDSSPIHETLLDYMTINVPDLLYLVFLDKRIIFTSPEK